MENNPYRSPESDLEYPGNFKRSVWWKLYFFFITIISAIGVASLLADPSAGFAEYIFLPIWLVATVGFFGFVFVKPIYRPIFWLQLLIAYLVVTVLYNFITEVDQRMGMNDTEFYIATAIGWLISLPSYYAIYQYGKPSNPAWKKLIKNAFGIRSRISHSPGCQMNALTLAMRNPDDYDPLYAALQTVTCRQAYRKNIGE